MRKRSARSDEDTGPPRRPGPPEPRLKIEGDWEEAAAKIIRTPVPKGGVPEKPKRERRQRRWIGVYLFWSRGYRVNEVQEYAAVLERQSPGAAEHLVQCQYIEEQGWTGVAVFGDDWREYLIRKPDWVEALDANTLPGKHAGFRWLEKR